MTRPEVPDRATPDDAPGSGPGNEAHAAPVPDAMASGTTEGEQVTEELSGTVAALTADDLDTSERRKLLSRLAGQIRARGIGDLFRPRAAMRWIADAVGDVAPRLPLRDR